MPNSIITNLIGFTIVALLAIVLILKFWVYFVATLALLGVLVLIYVICRF